MSLNKEERDTLVRLYLDKAQTTLADAKLAAEAGSWNMAANRLYYSLFHACVALFVNDGIAVGSHKGLKAKIGQYYVLTGKLDTKYSIFLAQMETLREKADYNIMFNASESDVTSNLEISVSFLNEIERLIKS